MRELKFRAWDKKKDDWVEFRGAGIRFPYIFDKNGSPNFKIIGFYVESDDLVFMQYTGLKDKSGKEICEGDILLVYNGAKVKQYKVVEWVETKLYTGFNVTDKKPNHKPYEIVGNIYENGDLLK